MVLGPVHLTTAASDDPPCPTVGRARRRHRVLVVVAGRLVREQPLTVLEHDAVAVVGEGTTGVDQGDRLLRLDRQGGQGDGGEGARIGVAVAATAGEAALVERPR